jgi:hypothetical protein
VEEVEEEAKEAGLPLEVILFNFFILQHKKQLFFR